MEKITFDEMWKRLEKYLRVNNALEQGFSNGKYTRILAQYAKRVVGIDIDENFLHMAQNNLKDCSNIELLLMDATNMSFGDKSFDVLLNTSFHEFDLSHNVFSMDLELKRRILEEMIRVSNTIVFVEPTEDAVTNELFTVFDPSEKHGLRISESNRLIDEFMTANGYVMVESGITYNDDGFSTREELEEAMLDWWADIKIPSNEEEKKAMIEKIDEILNRAGMLEKLHVIEDIGYHVYQRKVVK